MHNMEFKIWSVLLLLTVGFVPGQAQDVDAIIEGMNVRHIGPGAMSGRVTTIDVQRDRPEVIYIGTLGRVVENDRAITEGVWTNWCHCDCTHAWADDWATSREIICSRTSRGGKDQSVAVVLRHCVAVGLHA